MYVLTFGRSSGSAGDGVLSTAPMNSQPHRARMQPEGEAATVPVPVPAGPTRTRHASAQCDATRCMMI